MVKHTHKNVYACKDRFGGDEPSPVFSESGRVLRPEPIQGLSRWGEDDQFIPLDAHPQPDGLTGPTIEGLVFDPVLGLPEARVTEVEQRIETAPPPQQEGGGEAVEGVRRHRGGRAAG